MYFNDFNPVGVVLFLVIWYILQCTAYLKFFQKANKPTWAAFVPLYNYYIHIEIVGRPKWWFLMLFVPVVNFFVALTIHLDMMKSFGKYTYLDQVLGVVFAPIYMNYIAWSDTHYIDKATNIPKPKKSFGKEWFEAIVFAVFCATFIRWISLEAYVIPTGSMERSLLIGDFLFVNKAEYGPRTPQTIIQMPLTHQTIWGTQIPSYSRAVSLPSFRLPSFGKVEREDVVVFNYPVNDNYNQRQDGDFHPLDLKTHYIKRCVAISGETLEIKNTQVYVNGEASPNPPNMQHKYLVSTNEQIRDRIFDRIGIEVTSDNPKHYPGYGYIIDMNEEMAGEFKALPFVKSVTKQVIPEGEADPSLFVDTNYLPWNIDHYGPLTIPARGMTIEVNEETIARYGSTIKDYEGHASVEAKNGSLVINGESLTSYTFKKDYFFMMGDNRHASDDSRRWGLVPEEYIVGEAAFVWMSFSQSGSFLNKIRWNRLLMPIK